MRTAFECFPPLVLGFNKHPGKGRVLPESVSAASNSPGTEMALKSIY